MMEVFRHVTHEELQQLLRICYETQTVPMIWGRRGIGKTYAVREFAKSIGAEVLPIIVGGEDNLSFGGIPVNVNGNIVYTNLIRALTESLGADGRPVVVFLDDFTAGAAAIGSPLFTLIQSRILAGWRLPDNWMIVCAGNPPDVRDNATELPRPLMSRMVHCVLLPPTVDEWKIWALRNGINPSIVAFISVYPNLLLTEVGDFYEVTPRSWETASRMMEKAPDKETQIACVAYATTDAIATQFKAFTGSAALDIDSILRSGKFPKLTGIEQHHYFMTSLTALFASRGREVAVVLCDGIRKLPEIVVGTWGLILKAHPITVAQLAGDPNVHQLNGFWHKVRGEEK